MDPTEVENASLSDMINTHVSGLNNINERFRAAVRNRAAEITSLQAKMNEIARLDEMAVQQVAQDFYAALQRLETKREDA